MDPTVAKIYSRVGPTIRRGHRYVSCCTTVVVCMSKLIAVVNLKIYGAPLLLYMSDKTSILCLWYMI